MCPAACSEEQNTIRSSAKWPPLTQTFTQTPEPAGLHYKQLAITDPEAFKIPAGGENELYFSLNNTESSLSY